MRRTFSLSPLPSSLFWIEPMIRSDARRAPTTFLYATESRLRSCPGSGIGSPSRAWVGDRVGTWGGGAAWGCGAASAARLGEQVALLEREARVRARVRARARARVRVRVRVTVRVRVRVGVRVRVRV